MEGRRETNSRPVPIWTLDCCWDVDKAFTYLSFPAFPLVPANEILLAHASYKE